MLQVTLDLNLDNTFCNMELAYFILYTSNMSNKISNKTILTLTIGVIFLAVGILIATRFTSQKLQQESAPSPFEDESAKIKEAVKNPIDLEPTEKAVTIKDFNFTPHDLEVEPGDLVTIFNKDNVAHTLTSNTNLFDSGSIAAQSVVKIKVPDVEGIYEYHCTPHPNMKGEFRVKAKTN